MATPRAGDGFVSGTSGSGPPHPYPLSTSPPHDATPISPLTASPTAVSPISPVSPVSPSATARPPRRSGTSSLTDSFTSSRPPLGALAATGEAFGSAPSWSDLRRASSRSSTGSASKGRRRSSGVMASTPVAIQERRSEDVGRATDRSEGTEGRAWTKQEDPGTKLMEEAGEQQAPGSSEDDDEEEGKHGPWQATINGLKAFWRFFTKPLGFFVTIYMLNVVAWGGMLFLLLCNAAPAMCQPSCNDINSPRRIWIEIDSQILNALFCVTGFGLIPWRFRDLYYLLSWRLGHNEAHYLKLQEINSAWFRPAAGTAAIPETTIEEGTPQERETKTGEKAPATARWKLDYVIWLYVWNTFFQCCLSGFMWGMNRFNRPPWTTGLFVALACIVAGLAGGQVWWETRKVKAVEKGEGKKGKKLMAEKKGQAV
ncbi:hypothetical protein FPQ18DRAFT_377957 [Pyronema domesticum]|nr:hypothetical protein FPQ18DRAFT_377957 [Pyronema domesticum]